ncbi:unnamed protein product [Nesidiocoris tenuis]|uniref:adenine phosphoribosyltransferase n=1 Tax=Nesidiocoris tenuis TaxID=355587 RepID=A0A6H5GKY2_9HEMI|nr:unnamed protein product [Nesidiocoris tenuis]
MSCDDVERVKKIEFVKQHVRSYPDFPKKGILFRDIFSVFNDVEATRTLDCLIADHVKNLQKPIDAVIGLESRGFLFGPQIASILGVPFVPARKKGKLPGELMRIEYSLEYGTSSTNFPTSSYSLLLHHHVPQTGRNRLFLWWIQNC